MHHEILFTTAISSQTFQNKVGFFSLPSSKVPSVKIIKEHLSLTTASPLAEAGLYYDTDNSKRNQTLSQTANQNITKAEIRNLYNVKKLLPYISPLAVQ